jgi:probable rRNA maturation factor
MASRDTASEPMNAEGPHARTLRVLIAGDGKSGASARGLARWLRRVAPARARGLVGVAIVGDRRVRTLNKRYRGRDYPTDVLSFPACAPAYARRKSARATARQARTPQPLIPNPDEYLGDIVIARGVARRQAQTLRHSEATEMRVLALHGLLHLLGYDHERDGGTMARVERRLRRKGGLREGLIERGVGR